MNFQDIKVEVSDHIAVVTIDRPPVNAFTVHTRVELIDAFDSLSDRDDVRVAVLAGAGKHFTAGADLRAPRAGTAEAGGRRLGRDMAWAVMECSVPVICAIQGAALGAGPLLAAASDIAIASEDAFFALPEIDVAFIGGARFLMHILPLTKVREMAFTAQRVSAQEMYRLGAVTKVVPREQLMPTAMEVAKLVAAKSPLALRLTKEALNWASAMDIREGVRFEHDLNAILQKSEDAQEAKSAFREKRPPVWKGR